MSGLVYDIKEKPIIVDSKYQTVICLAEVSWNDRPFRMELRKWAIKGDEMIPQKGVTFMTPEGPHTLTETLIEQGFGDTKRILELLQSRPDFNDKDVTYNKKESNDKKEDTFIKTNKGLFSGQKILDLITEKE